MPKRRQTKKPLDRLPNAPLAEVVFEMRWKLQGSGSGIFLSDPGLLPLMSAFTTRAANWDIRFTRIWRGPKTSSDITLRDDILPLMM